MTRSEIQQKAVNSWVKCNKIGTFNVSTGVGKTFMFLHCLHTMPKTKLVHLFLAEVTDRKKDLDTDIEKFDKMFNVNTLNDYNLLFLTYQSAYKMIDKQFGLVCADEIHFSLTPEYSKFYFNNKYEAIVGLSATIDNSKLELLNKIAPICLTYTLTEAKNDGIGRNLRVYIISQELDAINKNIESGSKEKRFFQSEKKVYDYWDNQHKRSWFIEDKDTKEFKIRITATKRSNLLFNLPSKVEIVKKLLTEIVGKTIVFGNSLDSLLKITDNVVSSRNNEDENTIIRSNFDNGLIETIGSFKKLRQGANLDKLDNCIVMSYYSTEGHQIQQWGRLRPNQNKIGNVFILLTRSTQEEVWFQKMTKDLQDFEFVHCYNLEDCIKKYKQYEKN